MPCHVRARGAQLLAHGVSRACASHIARWRRTGAAHTRPALRGLALAALAKRGNIEGAAAFAAFAPRARRGEATKAPSAFQAAYNLLDMLGEQPSADPVPTDGACTKRCCSPWAGLLAHRRPPARSGGALDWYEHHPQREDGGYLDGAARRVPRRVREPA